MTEKTRKDITAYSAIFSMLALVFGGSFAVFEFYEQYETNINNEKTSSEQHNEDVAFQAQQPFLSKQLDLYLEAADDAAIIATTNDTDPNKAKAIEDFKRLYDGKLAVAESPKVACAMRTFSNCLDKKDCTPDQSLALAKEVRDSIQTTWKLSLPELVALKKQTEVVIHTKEGAHNSSVSAPTAGTTPCP